MAYWFGQSNLLDGLDATTLAASSVKGGSVGLPIKTGTGSAVAYTAGRYTGQFTVSYLVEIDDVSGGAGVGEATFRWKRSDSTATWEAQGAATSDDYLELDRGVEIKWVAGEGDDFVAGDSWTIIAAASFGLANLTDLNRDSAWRSNGLDSPCFITADLGGPYPGLLLHAPLEDDLDLEAGQGSLSFSRASAASYVDPDTGLTVVAGEDEPRFELINGQRALLLEPGQTNLVKGTRINGDFSLEDLGASAEISLSEDCLWYAVGVSDATFNPSLVDDPNRAAATGDAPKVIQLDAADTGADIYAVHLTTGLNNQLSLTSGQKYYLRFKVWCSVSRTFTVSVQQYLSPYASYGLNSTFATTAGQWTWVTRVFTCTKTGSDASVILFLGAGAAFTLRGPSQMSLIQVGADASADQVYSWIPTLAAAAARAAEEGQPFAQASGNFSQAAGTIYLEWTPRFSASDAPNNTTVGIATVSGAAAGLLYWHKDASGNCWLRLTDGTGTHSTALSPTRDATYLVYARWWASAEEKPGDGSGEAGMHVGFYSDSWTHGSETGYDGSFGAGASLELYKSGATHFSGYLGGLRIFGEALTKAQIEAGPENLGSTGSPAAVVILDHNFTGDALINLKYSDLDSEPAWAAAPSIPLTWSAGTVAKLDLSGEARFWRLEVTDPANPDEYIEISELFLGGGFSPAAIITGDESMERSWNLESVDHRPRNAFEFSFLAPSAAGEVELSGFLQGLLDSTSRRIKPVFFCFDTASVSNNTFLLKMKENLLRRVQAGRDHYLVPFRMVEAEKSGV